MNSQELSELGTSLAAQLDELAAKFHVKSDEYEILAWEADILRAKSRDILEQCGLSENLGESALLSQWGTKLSKEIPSISGRVREFHAQYKNQQT